MQNLPLRKLLTIRQAAALAGFSRSHITKLLKSGKVQGIQKGRIWYTTEKAVQDYLAIKRKPGPKPKQSSKEK